MIALVQPKLKPLLLALAETHPETLDNGLSLDDLSERANSSRRTVIRHLKSLRALGLVETSRPNAGRGNIFTFKLHPMVLHIATKRRDPASKR
jgi:DNA-binding IclR family transcriptional regulator